MQFTQLAYQNGVYQDEPQPLRLLDGQSKDFESVISAAGYEPMTLTIGSLNDGYFAALFRHPGKSASKPFLLVHGLGHEDTRSLESLDYAERVIYIVTVHNFPDLLRLLHEASTVAVPWPRHSDANP